MTLNKKIVALVSLLIVLVTVSVVGIFLYKNRETEEPENKTTQTNIHTDSYGNKGEVLKLNSEWYPAEYKKCGDIKEITISKEGLKVPCPNGLIYKVTIASETEEEDIDNVRFWYEESAADWSRHDPDLYIVINLGAYSDPDTIYTWFAKQGIEVSTEKQGGPAPDCTEACFGQTGNFEYKEYGEKNLITYIYRFYNGGSNYYLKSIKRGNSYDVIKIDNGGLKSDGKDFVDVVLEGMHY